MSEAEATEMLIAMGDVLATYLGLWVTSTFAYLTVAYFVGPKLSRFQNYAVSGLYVVAASSFALAALGHTDGFLELYQREVTVYRNIFFADLLPYYLPGFATIFVVGMFVSLYFMYNVRKEAESSGRELE